MLRLMRMWSVASAALVLMLVTSCTGGGTEDEQTPQDRASRVAFVPETGTTPMALLTGVLGGDAETGCLWVEHPRNGRVLLLLQHDSARLDTASRPPSVRDGDEIFAAFGDAVEATGAVGGTSPTVCGQADQTFTAHRLERAGTG